VASFRFPLLPPLRELVYWRHWRFDRHGGSGPTNTEGYKHLTQRVLLLPRLTQDVVELDLDHRLVTVDDGSEAHQIEDTLARDDAVEFVESVCRSTRL